MKFYVASIATETNTFAPVPTGMASFEELHIHRSGDVPARGLFRGAVQHLRELAAPAGHEVVAGLMAKAQPSGTTVRAVYEQLRDELLASLRAALPVQGVILPMHGAMVADGYPDCEGDLIERVREIVGPRVPIGVELDLHCHFTERMHRHADVIVAYKEYPHTDVLERLAEVWRLTVRMAEGAIHPVTEVFDCRMVGFWHTSREPMKGFVRRMQELEATPGVLSISFGHGFPYGDVPEAGAKVWVVADGDASLARRLAEQLGRELWAMRRETGGLRLDADGAIDQLLAAAPGRPVVMADHADNAGGGASSDSTFILRRLVERGVGNVALGAFWDLGAVHVCREAGVGSRLVLRLGGKVGPASGEPVDLPVTVRTVLPAHSQAGLGGSRAECGTSVWASTDEGLDLAIVSIRQQVFGTDLFTGLGIDLASQRGIVVKSSQHFYAAFEPLAGEVLYVDTPGLLRNDFERIPYRHRDMNYWPRVGDPWLETSAR